MCTVTEGRAVWVQGLAPGLTEAFEEHRGSYRKSGTGKAQPASLLMAC